MCVCTTTVKEEILPRQHTACAERVVNNERGAPTPPSVSQRLRPVALVGQARSHPATHLRVRVGRQLAAEVDFEVRVAIKGRHRHQVGVPVAHHLQDHLMGALQASVPTGSLWVS